MVKVRQRVNPLLPGKQVVLGVCCAEVDAGWYLVSSSDREPLGSLVQRSFCGYTL